MDDGRIFDGDPKSRAGTRTVAFPADILPELADHLERFADPKPNGFVFIGPKGGRLRRSNFREVWNRARGEVGLPELHFHDLRHTGNTMAERRGVAADATFRVRREAGAIRADGAATPRQRSRQQNGPAGQDGRDRTVLRLMPGCCVHSGCIRRKHDAAERTKKRSNEGRCHHRPVVALTHSAWLVIRSLPVPRRAPASRN